MIRASTRDMESVRITMMATSPKNSPILPSKKKNVENAIIVALKAKDAVAVATLRLILAAMKDRDIAARGEGNCDGVGEDEILQLLQKMIRQRREAIGLYEQLPMGASWPRSMTRSSSMSRACSTTRAHSAGR